jgi:hypothetical protein
MGSETKEEQPLYVGFDLSTQQLKGILSPMLAN